MKLAGMIETFKNMFVKTAKDAMSLKDYLFSIEHSRTGQVRRKKKNPSRLVQSRRQMVKHSRRMNRHV